MVEKFFIGCNRVGDRGMRRFWRVFLKFSSKKSRKDIWWIKEKCIPLHSLSGSKRASEEGRQAGGEAGGSCGAADAGGAPAPAEAPERERRKKKLKKNLEVTGFLLTFAKFFRPTKTGGLRATGSGAGNPRGH